MLGFIIFSGGGVCVYMWGEIILKFFNIIFIKVLLYGERNC